VGCSRLYVLFASCQTRPQDVRMLEVDGEEAGKVEGEYAKQSRVDLEND